MKKSLLIVGLLLCLVSGNHPAWGADATASAPATSAVPALAVASASGTPAPAAASSSAAPAAASGSASAPAASATGRRGGRGGFGGFGGQPSPADVAEMAKLNDLPAYTPGVGDGNYTTGPAYAPAPELTVRPDVPKGKVASFIMNAADSKFYPPSGKTGTAATRQVTVYIPSQYVPGTAAPFIISADAWGARQVDLPTILDNMIADHRLPAIIAIMVANGGGDGPGSERGLEYDTVSGKFAEFAEAEILPRVEKEYGVTLTKNPDARMTFGGSSGGSVAFSMAWFHPELYHLVLSYSGTFVNQQAGPDAPHGAWSYHETIIPASPVKPLRIWLEVGGIGSAGVAYENGSTSPSSGFHNWVIANERMADVLTAKGYHYQLVYAKEAKHTDARAVAQTLPQALAYIWKGYPIAPAKDAKPAPAASSTTNAASIAPAAKSTP